MLDVNPLLVMSFTNNFSHLVGCLFALFMVSFAVQKTLSVIRSYFFNFCFYFLCIRENYIPKIDIIYANIQRRKWQPIPVFLPGESQGRGSLVSCCLWGHTESDMT